MNAEIRNLLNRINVNEYNWEEIKIIWNLIVSNTKHWTFLFNEKNPKPVTNATEEEKTIIYRNAMKEFLNTEFEFIEQYREVFEARLIRNLNFLFEHREEFFELEEFLTEAE